MKITIVLACVSASILMARPASTFVPIDPISPFITAGVEGAKVGLEVVKTAAPLLKPAIVGSATGGLEVVKKVAPLVKELAKKGWKTLRGSSCWPKNIDQIAFISKFNLKVKSDINCKKLLIFCFR